MWVLKFAIGATIIGCIIAIVNAVVKTHKYNTFSVGYTKRQYDILDEILEIRNRCNLKTNDLTISLIKQRDTSVLAGSGSTYCWDLLECRNLGGFYWLPDDGDVPLAHHKDMSKEDRQRVKELAIRLKKNELQDTMEYEKSGIGDAINAQKEAAQKHEDTAITRGAIIGGAIGGPTGAVVGAVAAAEKKSNKKKELIIFI